MQNNKSRHFVMLPVASSDNGHGLAYLKSLCVLVL